MKYKTDLHLHSVLSACCSRDNTLCNLVNMSALLGTQIIALADHNSALNVAAFAELAKQQGILAIPAIEVTTAEDIHVLCLFRTKEDALLLSQEIADSTPRYPLDTRAYYPQSVLNSQDGEVDSIPYLLNVACGYDVYSLYDRVTAVKGAFIPAHIDRQGSGMLDALGALPPDLPFCSVELTRNADVNLRQQCAKQYHLLSSSDAHSLEELATQEFYLELPQLTVDAVLDYLTTPLRK